MNYEFTTVGALIGLAVAIILIIKKLQPAYSLILGALIGFNGFRWILKEFTYDFSWSKIRIRLIAL
jgi:divalent metal cation (Fe/Co/Zn/Cd) transporter